MVLKIAESDKIIVANFVEQIRKTRIPRPYFLIAAGVKYPFVVFLKKPKRKKITSVFRRQRGKNCDRVDKKRVGVESIASQRKGVVEIRCLTINCLFFFPPYYLLFHFGGGQRNNKMSELQQC